MTFQETRRRFKSFYRVNSVVFFFLFGVGALVTANCLIFLTDFISFNCSNLPFLSYDPEQVTNDNTTMDLLLMLTSLLSELSCHKSIKRFKHGQLSSPSWRLFGLWICWSLCTQSGPCHVGLRGGEYSQ